MMVRLFRYHDIDTVVIISVNSHTARARRIFRKLSQGYPHVLVYPAESPLFVPSSWWSSREGRKTWLMEWAKTVATWFELMASSPETGKAETNGLIGTHTLPPSATLPTAAFLDSIAAAVARESERLPDSLAAAQGDTADTAAAPPSDSARTEAFDSAEKADPGPTAAKGGTKDSETPKASA
jgi:hypothetical protein